LLFPVCDLTGHVLLDDGQTILDFFQVVTILVLSRACEALDVVPTVEGCPAVDGHLTLWSVEESHAAAAEGGRLLDLEVVEEANRAIPQSMKPDEGERGTFGKNENRFV
jgi:hypothetical protein